MTNAVWPASLPQRCEVADYEETPVDNTIRSPMAVGTKMRSRDPKEVRQVNVALRMSASQWATLREFYVETLAQGSLRFDHVEWTAPGTPMTYSFTSAPTPRAISPTRFRVSVRLVTE